MDVGALADWLVHLKVHKLEHLGATLTRGVCSNHNVPRRLTVRRITPLSAGRCDVNCLKCTRASDPDGGQQ